MSDNKWIGVDLDGCLAEYQSWQGGDNDIGPPIPLMVERVKRWLAEGLTVKIFTARVNHYPELNRSQTLKIQLWCSGHIGQVLEVTCRKDYRMTCLYDDRCVQVEKNTGRLIGQPDERSAAGSPQATDPAAPPD